MTLWPYVRSFYAFLKRCLFWLDCSTQSPYNLLSIHGSCNMKFNYILIRKIMRRCLCRFLTYRYWQVDIIIWQCEIIVRNDDFLNIMSTCQIVMSTCPILPDWQVNGSKWHRHDLKIRYLANTCEDIFFWQVDIIIWQVMAEIFHHNLIH